MDFLELKEGGQGSATEDVAAEYKMQPHRQFINN